jgi:hypothetical protein
MVDIKTALARSARLDALNEKRNLFKKEQAKLRKDLGEISEALTKTLDRVEAIELQLWEEQKVVV